MNKYIYQNNIKQEFINAYRSEVNQNSREYEKIRQKYLREINYSKSSVITANLLILLVIYAVACLIYSPVYAFVVLLIYPICVFSCLSKIYYDANKNYLSEIKYDLCESIFKKIGYIRFADADNDFTEFSNSGLFDLTNGHYAVLDDKICGYYDTVRYTIYEAIFHTDDTRLEYLYQYLNKTRRVIITFDFNRHIFAKTKVYERVNIPETINYKIVPLLQSLLYGFMIAFPASLLIFIILNSFYIHFTGETFFIVFSAIMALSTFIIFKYFLCKQPKKANKIKLEDVEFNNRFTVESDNEIESRYLLTTAFMERLINLKTAFGNKNLRCSFYGKKLMISIETKKDLFEIAELKVPLEKSRAVYAFANQLGSIFDMIDYFKLSEDTKL